MEETYSKGAKDPVIWDPMQLKEDGGNEDFIVVAVEGPVISLRCSLFPESLRSEQFYPLQSRYDAVSLGEIREWLADRVA
jgi:hypothetical protein